MWPDTREAEIIPLAMWDLESVNPLRSTAHKMVEMEIMQLLDEDQAFRGLVLSPQTKKMVSPADHRVVKAWGIAVVQCAWTDLKSVNFKQFHNDHERICASPTCSLSRVLPITGAISPHAQSHRSVDTHIDRHTHTHIYIYTYAKMYVHTYMHAYVHTYIHMCMHTNLYTHNIHTVARQNSSTSGLGCS